MAMRAFTSSNSLGIHSSWRKTWKLALNMWSNRRTNWPRATMKQARNSSQPCCLKCLGSSSVQCSFQPNISQEIVSSLWWSLAETQEGALFWCRHLVFGLQQGCWWKHNHWVHAKAVTQCGSLQSVHKSFHQSVCNKFPEEEFTENQIMDITGHKSVNSFQLYQKVSPIQMGSSRTEWTMQNSATSPTPLLSKCSIRRTPQISCGNPCPKQLWTCFSTAFAWSLPRRRSKWHDEMACWKQRPKTNQGKNLQHWCRQKPQPENQAQLSSSSLIAGLETLDNCTCTATKTCCQILGDLKAELWFHLDNAPGLWTVIKVNSDPHNKVACQCQSCMLALPSQISFWVF